MNIVTEIKVWQKLRKELGNKTIGFIPTMGHLHAGHLSLCARSIAENDVTVASIFINPTQFNEVSDFQRYPRTMVEDKALLETLAVDYLLLPEANDMYPDDYHVQVSESYLSKELEGEFRPGHFTGMLTVVLKFLNLVQPNKAYFGEKDYQQYLLIKKMCDGLFLPTEIIACETIRANDGLALSSRNSRLNANERAKAAIFPKILQSSLTSEQISEELKALGFKVDYVVDKWQRRLGAVWLNDIRLIDNILKVK